MNKNLVCLFCFFFVITAIFGEEPNQDQSKQAGKGIVEKLALSIGEQLPNNTIKINENTYKLQSENDAMEGITEVFSTKENVVISHGYINMTQYEDISKVMFKTLLSALSAYLGNSTQSNGNYSWYYKSNIVSVSSPQYRNGAWVCIVNMVENTTVAILNESLIESLKKAIGKPVPSEAQRVAYNYFLLSDEYTDTKISGKAFTTENGVVIIAEYKWIRLSTMQDLEIIEQKLYNILDVYGEPKNNGKNLVYPPTNKYTIMVMPTYLQDDQYILQLAIIGTNP